MGWLNFIFGKKRDSRHENHTSHTQKSSNSNKTDTTYRSAAPNDGFSRDHPQDSQPAKGAQLPHRSQHRNENPDQTRHVYKRSYSVTERIEYIGDYIDDWNYKNRHHDPIKINIIILEGLLDINQNLTEPRSGSQIKFICKPGKLWDDELYPEKLHRACEKLEWHTRDRWRPHTLNSGVRKRMFEVTDKDRPVYESEMKGLIIRGPPPDYRICQRIDRLRGWESKHKIYKSELSKIVKDIQSYINSNKEQLEDMRSKSGRGMITPRDLIKEWQKDYHFEFSNVLLSLKDNRAERSKPREHSGTRSHESHRVNGPHDSAVSLSNTGRRAPSKSRPYKSSNYSSDSDTSTSTRPRRVNKQHDSAVSLSGASERTPFKSHAHKPSDYISDSDTSTRSRRRTQDPSQPLFQRKPPTKSNRDTLPRAAPHTRPPAIKINSSSEDKGRSPCKSPSRKSPGRSPRTPRTPVDRNHVYQNPGHPPLPPSSHSLNPDLQKSPPRPGSGGRGMAQKRSHRDLLHPSTSQAQLYSYPHVNSNDNSESRPEMRPRKSHRDLFDENSNQSQWQQHSNSRPYAPTNSNRRNGYPKPPHQDPAAVSPLGHRDMSWEGLTPEQKDKIHREAMEELRLEELRLEGGDD
ncbi:hypothetical protein BCON_0909g00010 [Botryotinia convoluta]|uniref:Uncharacterized protein n=1 Tax=Botryotinia convoluta TaxID=54673 RepID=A0A4Z1H4X8_9HELO|nr:hypothetical protein BCON_0909g00010 [Botryotinia convoluta]